MREEWVFILSTCAVIVKLRGLWCDMTGDCFKCPHQRNGRTCLGVTAKKDVHLHYMGICTCLVNSCGNLPKQNECVPADAEVSFKTCWCAHVHAGVQYVEVMCVNMYAFTTQLCTYEFLDRLYILSIPRTHLLAVEHCTEIKGIFHQ